MKTLFHWRRSAREPGWLAVFVQPGLLHFAHGISAPGSRSTIKSWGTRTHEDSPAEFQRVTRELGVERHQCLSVLPATDYQLLLVDAPNVPAAELKSAVRWKLKDMLDYPVNDATIDVLDIPVPPAGARGHSMYAVAARNDVIKGTIDRFTAAQVPLSVIDIGETAQRNIAALFEPPERALGMLYLAPRHALLTVNFRAELYLARRIDVGTDQLLAASSAQQTEAMNRVLLELQRSLDHLDRQFPFLTMAKLLLAPEPRDSGLAAHLSANLGLPVERAQLQQVVDFPDGAPDDEAAWRLFHVLGAALRGEAKLP
jgi:MSHA biogenesis protein MshI